MKQAVANMDVITVTNLGKDYEYYRKEPGFKGTLKSYVSREKLFAEAVRDISFTVAEGEIVGFLGPNGAGKTTTLKMLSGILYPSRGTARVLGFDPQQRQNEFKRQFGIVMGQKDQMSRLLPPMDSFLLFKELYGVPDAQFNATLDELCTLLDIPLKKLSLGQRMKCELVGALIHSPQVLFLDEPTIGLDVVAQKNIRDFIRKYNKEKRTTILLTSHYMDDIKELCKRVIIINFGQIIYDGNLDALIATYAKRKMVRVTVAERVDRALFDKFGEVEDYQGTRASILVPRGSVKEVAAALAGSSLPIEDIGIDEMPIDDIIRSIFESHSRI